MTRALVIAVLACAATSARADTFENRASGAQRIRRLDDLVWPFVAACDKGDDVHQRQCKKVRDRRLDALAGATVVVEAEASAFAAGAWNAAKKSVPLTLVSCVSCNGVELDGKKYFLTGAQPRLDGGKLRGGVLYDNAKTFADDASASAWTKTLANVRVELVVKIPANRKLPTANKDGLLLDIVAWRVITPCDGSIVIAQPESAAVVADKQACTPAPATKP
jgi:hypothetical protein